MNTSEVPTPAPEWARILSGALYGFALLKLVGMLGSASMFLNWTFKQGYGWDAFAWYSCLLTVSYWLVGAAELLGARTVVRHPQVALRLVRGLTIATTLVIIFVLCGSFAIYRMMPSSVWMQGTWNSGTPWLAGLALYVPTLLVLRSRRAQMLRRADDPACCANCGYALTGLTEPRCPECGTAIEVNQDEK